MKFVSWLILLLAIFAPLKLTAKTLHVHYYPESGGSALTFAFSPNATDAGPGANPTGLIQPYSTLTVQVPDGVRFWYYTPAVGWLYFATSSSDTTIKNDGHLWYDSAAGAPYAWETEPISAGSGGGGSLDGQNVIDGFIAGFSLAFPLLLFGLVLRVYRRLGDSNPSL